MTIQNRTSSLAHLPADYVSDRKAYYAAVPAHMLEGEGNLIDELIKFTFDVLGGARLDVRVYHEAGARLLALPDRSHEPSLHCGA